MQQMHYRMQQWQIRNIEQIELDLEAQVAAVIKHVPLTDRESETVCESEVRIQPQTKQPLENCGQPYRKPWTDLN